MADDLHLDDTGSVETVPISRFKEISKKQIEATQAKEAAEEGRKNSELERDKALKEAEFANSFADITSIHPNAREHKDEIKTKVLAGYTVEDATVSVLNKAGKLTPARTETRSPAGGSATTTSIDTTPKSLQELSREEKRKMIQENDSGILEYLRTGR